MQGNVKFMKTNLLKRIVSIPRSERKSTNEYGVTPGIRFTDSSKKGANPLFEYLVGIAGDCNEEARGDISESLEKLPFGIDNRERRRKSVTGWKRSCERRALAYRDRGHTEADNGPRQKFVNERNSRIGNDWWHACMLEPRSFLKLARENSRDSVFNGRFGNVESNNLIRKITGRK